MLGKFEEEGNQQRVEFNNWFNFQWDVQSASLLLHIPVVEGFLIELLAAHPPVGCGGENTAEVGEEPIIKMSHYF